MINKKLLEKQLKEAQELYDNIMKDNPIAVGPMVLRLGDSAPTIKPSEIKHLVALGLWAKQHGIPALEKLREDIGEAGFEFTYGYCYSALEKLPKETK